MIPGVTQEIIRAWKHNFPAVDIELELCRIELWLAKHPSKTYKKPLRMCEKWFKRVTVNARNLVALQSKPILTERELITIGREKGIEAKPGETREAFERRVRAG